MYLCKFHGFVLVQVLLIKATTFDVNGVLLLYPRIVFTSFAFRIKVAYANLSVLLPKPRSVTSWQDKQTNTLFWGRRITLNSKWLPTNRYKRIMLTKGFAVTMPWSGIQFIWIIPRDKNVDNATLVRRGTYNIRQVQI